MREYAKKPDNKSRTLDSNPRASKQAPISEVLQVYQNRTLGKPVQQEEIDDELLQPKFDVTQREEFGEDELIQPKLNTTQREELDEDELLQPKFESASAVEQTPIQREEKPNNTGLPDNLKSGIESLSGYSMDDVKVHYNSDKPTQLQALAYAQGTDIHVAPGQEKHLPHEAWHVVQQKKGRVQPTMQLQGVNVNDNEGLEEEADTMGSKALNLTTENIRQDPLGLVGLKNFAVLNPKTSRKVSSDLIQAKWQDFNENYYKWDSLILGFRWYAHKTQDLYYYIIESKEILNKDYARLKDSESKQFSYGQWISAGWLPTKEPEIINDHELSEEQKGYLDSYTGGGYKELNSKLRSKKYDQDSSDIFQHLLYEKFQKELLPLIEAVDSLPKYGSEMADKYVYRGLAFKKNEELQTYLKMFEEGNVYIAEQFLSTSISTIIAERFGQGKNNVLMRILCRGRNGADLMELYKGKDLGEREILFKPGSKFRVTEARKSQDGNSLSYIKLIEEV